MGYLYTPSYTPRHLRRRRNASKNGNQDQEKARMFRRVSAKSKRFIFQKASQLQKEGPLNREYMQWCAKASKGTGFR